MTFPRGRFSNRGASILAALVVVAVLGITLLFLQSAAPSTNPQALTATAETGAPADGTQTAANTTAAPAAGTSGSDSLDTSAPKDCNAAKAKAFATKAHDDGQAISTDKGESGTLDACYGAITTVTPPTSVNDYECFGRSGTANITSAGTTVTTKPDALVPEGKCKITVCQSLGTLPSQCTNVSMSGVQVLPSGIVADAGLPPPPQTPPDSGAPQTPEAPGTNPAGFTGLPPSAAATTINCDAANAPSSCDQAQTPAQAAADPNTYCYNNGATCYPSQADEAAFQAPNSGWSCVTDPTSGGTECTPSSAVQTPPDTTPPATSANQPDTTLPSTAPGQNVGCYDNGNTCYPANQQDANNLAGLGYTCTPQVGGGSDAGGSDAVCTKSSAPPSTTPPGQQPCTTNCGGQPQPQGKTPATPNSTFNNGSSNGLSSLLAGLARGLAMSTAAPAAAPAAPAQACSIDPNAYAQQQQQYQQQLQQYNYQLQQYQYQQQLQQYNSQYYGSSYGSYGYASPPAMPAMPQPCTPSTQQQCSAQMTQPVASTCTSGTWQPTYSGSCISNWQCVPSPCSTPPAQPTSTCTNGMTLNPTYTTGTSCVSGWQCSYPSGVTPVTPVAQMSCQPQLADVGMTLAISYSCSVGTSTPSGFVTNGAQSGSATTTITTPPTGANTATYSLTCNNQGITAGAQCSVQVNQPSIILVANPKTVASGGSSLLGWITTGMKSCVVSSPDQPDFTSANAYNTSVNGVADTSPITGPTEFDLNCQTLAGGARSASTTVDVGSGTSDGNASSTASSISVSSSADGVTVNHGDTMSITWTSTGEATNSAVALWLFDARTQTATDIIAGAQPLNGTYSWQLPAADSTCSASNANVCGSDLVAGRQYLIEADVYTPSDAYVGDGSAPTNPITAVYGDGAWSSSPFTIGQ